MRREVLWGILLSVSLVALATGAYRSSAGAPAPDTTATPASRGVEVEAVRAVGPLRLSAAAPAVLNTMSEDFEGSWPGAGWQLVDSGNADLGQYLWATRDCHPRRGGFAIWSHGGGADGGVLTCWTKYRNYTATWAVYGPFDLSTAADALLTFHLWGRSEGGSGCPFDRLFVASSIDGNTFSGNDYCDNWTDGPEGNGYYRRSLDLRDRLGRAQVWVAFALQADEAITDHGFHIDDVWLNTNVTRVTLQQGLNGYTGARDAYLDRFQPNVARGGATSLYLHINQVFGTSRSILLDFDLSTLNLPPQTEILEAKLFLYQHQQTGSATLFAPAYALTRPWTEPQTTWTEARSGASWAVPGANGVPHDRQDIAPVLVDVGSFTGWKRWDVTHIVADWVRQPEKQQGILLQALGVTEVDTIASFYAKEAADGALRPRLEFVYVIPPPTLTPTPTSTATPTPTNTPTITPTATDSPSPTPTLTSTLTPSATPTDTPAPSETPTSTATGMPTSTPTSSTLRQYLPLLLK